MAQAAKTEMQSQPAVCRARNLAKKAALKVGSGGGEGVECGVGVGAGTAVMASTQRFHMVKAAMRLRKGTTRRRNLEAVGGGAGWVRAQESRSVLREPSRSVALTVVA